MNVLAIYTGQSKISYYRIIYNMVKNDKQAFCYIEGDGGYSGYQDNERFQELMKKGWRITNISSAHSQSYRNYCYVVLEAPVEETKITV